MTVQVRQDRYRVQSWYRRRVANTTANRYRYEDRSQKTGTPDPESIPSDVIKREQTPPFQDQAPVQ